jgi:serine/threonine-protein kinase
MDQDLRRRVEEVFEEIIELSPDRWDAALDRLGGESHEVRVAVRRLLKAHGRADGVLDGPSPFSEARGGDVGADLPAGELIGRYRILEVIGKGGMGTVYLAERADGHFKQRVALKLIPRVDPELHARVVAERQILASLQHPNIARLLDGGATEDGRPFLVMEYVCGLPVDVYCDRMRLSPRERLKLFLTVLGAVEHAHRNLVVHRDLKPSNILVSPSGEVKLLDFGIAKILNPDMGRAEVPVTRREQRALTPEYASPEQVRGEAITTAADVYSLGVILYELLSGLRPYEIADGSLSTLIRVVCEDDPPPPSLRWEQFVGADGADPGEVTEQRRKMAAARYTTTARLARSLKGDLDAIVMKALRKEPSRRYTSLELFGQDIRHFLEGLPVTARRGSRWYRVQKLARRHRTGALASSGVVLALIVGAGMAAWQAGVASDQRDMAQAALRESEEVTEFLLGLFDTSDPRETPGDTVTVLDLLQRGKQRVDSLQGEPVIQSRLLQVMARANQNLGRYEEASNLAGKAVNLLEAEFGDENHDLAGALGRLGVSLSASGRYDSARVVLQRALGHEMQWHGQEVPEMGDLLEALARVTIYLGDLGEAESQARRALTIKERFLGPNDPSTLNTLAAMASIYRFQGRYQLSEESFREVLSRRRALPDPDLTRLTGDLLQISGLLTIQNRDLDEAVALTEEAMQLLHDGSGMSSPNFVWGLTSLAVLREMGGDIQGAEELLLQALDVRRRTFGQDHPLVSGSIGEYASFLYRNGRAVESERMFRSAIQINLRTVGPNHALHAGTLTGLAMALQAQGRLEEADSVMEESIRIRSGTQGRRTPLIAQNLASWADIKTLMGSFDEAESLLEEAMDIASDESLAGVVPGRIHAAFVRLYEAKGMPEKAAAHRELALDDRIIL